MIVPLYLYFTNFLQEVWTSGKRVQPEKKKETIAILKKKDGDQRGP